MSTSLENKSVPLICSDGETFEVEMAVAIQSENIEHLIEDVSGDGKIPFMDVTGPILSKVIEYIKKNVQPSTAGKKEEDEGRLRDWDNEFVKVDQHTLFDLIMAANFLNIKGLLDFTCQAVANMIQEMSPEEIREMFNIKNDFTPEEEEELRRQSQCQWAFD